MKQEIDWLNDALATKDVVPAQTYYLVKNRVMLAYNGRITAGCPCSVAGEFCVPGEELSAILQRLPDEPTIKVVDDRLTLRSGRFSGSLRLLPAEEWRFPILESDVTWVKFPMAIIPILKELRGFVSDNAIHRWSLGIAIDDGWCYSTNNVVLAGAPFDPVRNMTALIPAWVVDFLLSHTDGLVSWAVTDTYMAFRWRNGGWMRSTLIDDKFPERASEMIRSAPKGSQKISDEYRRAVTRITELSDDKVSIYADKVEGMTERSKVEEAIKSLIPAAAPASIWGAKFLGPAMAVATSWSPNLWPAPVPFHGSVVRGYIAGRTA